jgi:hypothetical protein
VFSRTDDGGEVDAFCRFFGENIWSEGVSAVRPLRFACNSAIELTASRYNGCIASVLQRSATDSAGEGDIPDKKGRLPLRIIEPELLAGTLHFSVFFLSHVTKRCREDDICP